MAQKCGHKDCTVSIGIHDGLTFGRGRVDDYGYFEFPCYVCARENEKIDKVPLGAYWPFPMKKEKTKLKFIFDINRHVAKYSIGFGLCFGSNRRDKYGIENLFLEIDFLFWTIGFEVRKVRG